MKFVCKLSFLLFLLFPLIVVAQTSILDEERFQNSERMIEGWRAELEQMSKAIKREGISDDELLQFRSRIGGIRNEAIVFSENLKPTLQNLQNRLDRLTQAEKNVLPAQNDVSQTEDTETELPAENESDLANNGLQGDIEGLNADLAKLNAWFGRSEVVVLRSDELFGEISQLRRDKFTQQLLGRSKSLLSPFLWLNAFDEIEPLLKGFVSLLTSGMSRILSEVPILFFSILVAGSFLLALMWHYLKRVPITTDDEKSGAALSNQLQYQRCLNAFRQIARNIIILTLVPFMVLVGLDEAGVLAERLSELLWTILRTIFYYALARGLSRAILAPSMQPYRLVNLTNRSAINLHRTVISCLTIVLIGFMIVDFAKTLVASVDFIAFVYGVTAISFALTAFSCYFLQSALKGDKGNILPTILIIRILLILMFLGLIIAFFAPLIGYANLAAFATGQVILAGIISSFLYLLFMFSDSFFNIDGDVEHSLANNETSLRNAQAMMLFVGASKIVATLFGISFLAASWGLDTTSIWGSLFALFQEIRIGDLVISPSTILTGLLVFALGLLIVRSLKRWLANRFLPTTKLDIGLRNSIVTGFGYLGFIIAAMIAFSQAGLDLSNLAIVAGALSLGIGFGLQSIVSNFVSGIILLAERPIKVGDWISVGGEEGTVKKISVRSTEIETFDRASVIVPNADFISGSVKNMMHGNKTGRFIIPVGVGYDSDPEQVREILLDVAKHHPLVLTYPQAHVIFADFGASSLDFQLRGFLADVGNSLSVRSDLRFAIFKRLKEEGVEIPFPQRDLNVKGLEQILAKTKDNLKND